jgi:transposase
MGLQGKERRTAVNHAAIDLGSKESQVCVRSPSGDILWERKQATKQLPELLRTWEHCRVVVETSSEAFRVADAAKAAGHEVRVVPSTLSRQLGVGERGIKTDVRDARKLSEVSCKVDLASVHVPSHEARLLRSVLRSREALVEIRTKTVNHIRGWMRTQLWRLPGRGLRTLAARMRAQANEQQKLPDHIEQMLQVLDTLNAQVQEADRRVKTLARESAICARLMSIPGVGPVTALSFVAAIDDVTRFHHAYRVHSYIGLTPGENSSSERQRRTSITKAGPTSIRRTLVQAAWVAMRVRPMDRMVQWAKQVEARRGSASAVVALARKMSGVMYALWRDNTMYQSSKAAALQPSA